MSDVLTAFCSFPHLHWWLLLIAFHSLSPCCIASVHRADVTSARYRCLYSMFLFFLPVPWPRTVIINMVPLYGFSVVVRFLFRPVIELQQTLVSRRTIPWTCLEWPVVMYSYISPPYLCFLWFSYVEYYYVTSTRCEWVYFQNVPYPRTINVGKIAIHTCNTLLIFHSLGTFANMIILVIVLRVLVSQDFPF